MPNSQSPTEENIVGFTNHVLKEIRKNFHRHCIILSGNQSWCHATVRTIVRNNPVNHYLVAANTPIDIKHGEQIRIGDAPKYLGHEFEHAIIDLHDGIDPNALGALSGVISGGGFMILLSPALAELDRFKDPEKQRMTIWPHGVEEVGNRFLQRFRNIILDSKNISLIQENNPLPCNITTQDIADTNGYLEGDACRTVDQQQAVEAIEHVVHGHRRRPLVLTANRGRGKSAALGIAAARLLQQGTQRIIATGPRTSATAMVFKHAHKLLDNAQHNGNTIITDLGRMEFIAPDRLCKEKPSCNLLLVDEAAAIPATILRQLLQHYARIVFATTTHGYEGTGRGFAVKFQETLNHDTPGWRALQMDLPIRWAPDDPVEKFVFRSLCLDATIAETDLDIRPQSVEITKLDRDTLIENESLLSSIFGLLVLAHYQTQPRDLRYLLDAIDLDIFIATHQGRLLGTALVEREGQLDSNTAAAVYRNERRVVGHLLPQTLESFAGIQNASEASYARIVRIAVHPNFRRNGIGQKLLQTIESDARQQALDIVGSTFGASHELLGFWQCAGYSPVHVGLTRNAGTGGNAISYVKPLSPRGKHIFLAAQHRFTGRFTFLLSEAYQELDCDVVMEIYKQTAEKSFLHVTQAEWDDINSFAIAARGYEINAFPIYKMIAHLFETGQMEKACNIQEQRLLIQKVLQRHPWQTVIDTMGLSGKKSAIQYLRHTLLNIINDASILKSIDIN